MGVVTMTSRGWIQMLSCVSLVLGLVNCQMITNYDIIRETSQRNDASIKLKSESQDIIAGKISQDKAIDNFSGQSHDSSNAFKDVVNGFGVRPNEVYVRENDMKYTDDNISNDQKVEIQDKSTVDCNARLKSLEATVAMLVDEIKTLKSKTGSTEPSIPISPNASKDIPTTVYGVNKVGFHVSLTRMMTLKIKDTLKFDRVVTNIGNSYDVNSGEFKAPTSGLYVFSVNVACDSYSYMEISIQKNGVPFFNAVSDNRQGNIWNQGGGTAIVNLAAGDKVKVVMSWPSFGAEMTALGLGFTSFTGYLLNTL